MSNCAKNKITPHQDSRSKESKKSNSNTEAKLQMKEVHSDV